MTSPSYTYDSRTSTITIEGPDGYENLLHSLAADPTRTPKTFCLRDANTWNALSANLPSRQQFIQSTASALGFPASHRLQQQITSLSPSELQAAALLLCIFLIPELKCFYLEGFNDAATHLGRFITETSSCKQLVSPTKFAQLGRPSSFGEEDAQPGPLIASAFSWALVPNVAALRLLRLSDEGETLGDLRPSDRRTSSVRHLLLGHCQPSARTLGALLALPRVLETFVLHFEAYDSLSDVDRAGLFHLSKLKTDLSAHEETLTTLALLADKDEVYQPVDSNETFGGLREFAQLRTLVIPFYFLAGVSPWLAGSRGELTDWLPSSIENLAIDVFEYRARADGTLEGAVTDAIHQLAGLVKSRERFPRLRRILLQGTEESADEGELRALRDLCENAGVEFAVSTMIAFLRWHGQSDATEVYWDKEREGGEEEEDGQVVIRLGRNGF